MSGDEPRLLRRGRPGYPAALIPCEPVVEGIWVLGADPGALGPMIAIVGARAATAYGTDVAFALGADLAARGIGVVSGMALGIDGAAHEGALAAGGSTIAVLACGVDRPYPASHAGLHRRILGAGGSIVSELPPGTGVRKHLFGLRNRIIAGLALGVVVVQARADRSGVTSTVEAAAALGRPVFAVPGDVRSDLSGLPHRLLREGAVLCGGAGDIEHELASDLGRPAVVPDEPIPVPPDATPEVRAVIAAMDDGPAGVDVLAARARIDVVTAARALTRCELTGLAWRDPTGRYRRVVAGSPARGA